MRNLINKTAVGFLLISLFTFADATTSDNLNSSTECDYTPELGVKISENVKVNQPLSVCIPSGAKTMTITALGAGGGLGGVVGHVRLLDWIAYYRNGGGTGGEASAVYYLSNNDLSHHALVIAAGGGGGGGAEMDISVNKEDYATVEKSFPGNGGGGAQITATYNLSKLDIKNQTIYFIVGQAGGCDQGRKLHICSLSPQTFLTSKPSKLEFGDDVFQYNVASADGKFGYCPDRNITQDGLVNSFYPVGGFGGYNYLIEGIESSATSSGKSVTNKQEILWGNLPLGLQIPYPVDNISNSIESKGALSGGFGGEGGGGYPGGGGGGAGQLTISHLSYNPTPFLPTDGAYPYFWQSFNQAHNGSSTLHSPLPGEVYAEETGAGGGGDGGYSVVKELYALIGTASCSNSNGQSNGAYWTSGPSNTFSSWSAGNGSVEIEFQ